MRSARSKTKTSPFCPVFRPLTGFLFPSGTFPCLDIFSWLKTQILKFGFLSLLAYMYFHQIEEKIMRNFVNSNFVSTFAKSKQILRDFLTSLRTKIEVTFLTWSLLKRERGLKRNFYYCR
nr:MAG TPA: hypothetical protein [Caudoviricetes sp.]